MNFFTGNPACSANEFRCQSGQCIRKDWKCDGRIGCDDGSDESAKTCCKFIFSIQTNRRSFHIRNEIIKLFSISVLTSCPLCSDPLKKLTNILFIGGSSGNRARIWKSNAALEQECPEPNILNYQSSGLQLSYGYSFGANLGN